MTDILLAVSLWMAATAGVLDLRAKGRGLPTSVPVLTATCALAITAVSLLQLTIAPRLLPLLMRTTPRGVAAEPWRLATSLVVQDGGWSGFAFNVVGLLIVGSVAERLLGRLRWMATAGFSVAAAQAVALVWQPIGAGNSILNFGLAGGLCAACLLHRPPGAGPLAAAVAGGCLVALLLAGDIHGAAGVTGALVALLLAPAGDRRLTSDSRK